MSSKISPKPSQSKHQQLGPIFGDPISTLDPSSLPNQFQTVKFWMFHHDNARTSRKMSSDIKVQVRKQLLSSLVSIWESRNIEVADQKTLHRRYENLINGADHLGKDPRCKRSDPAAVAWREKKKNEYDMVFDIGVASSRHSSAPTTPMKRKSDDMVSFLLGLFH